jgi:N-acetyl-anhydromuramyl-L-alanine amidase AmpD
MKFTGKSGIVKEVQSSLGIDDDGVDGPTTWKMIWENLVHEESVKKPEPPAPPAPAHPRVNDYPEVYKASPNQSRTIKPRFVVLHHSSGSHNGTKSWILNPVSQVSYHYLIAGDGSRTQFVYDTKKAWHAGKSNWNGIIGLNSYSIGVSFYGDTYKRTPNVVEIDSAAKKCIYLMDKFDFGIDGILTHEMISPGRKNDPSEETYELVIARIKALSAQ